MKYIALILSSLICGCTVTPQEFNAASKKCEPFGGLEYYENPVQLFDTLVGDSHCKDGTVISSFVLEDKEK